MKRSFDDAIGKSGPEFDPRTLLQSIERHLAQSRPVTNKNVEAAQQLVYDAWDARSDAEQEALIFSALKLDPLNADALVRAGEYAGLSGEAEISYLRRVVAAGEKGLGPKVFKEAAGHFGGFVETRPYPPASIFATTTFARGAATTHFYLYRLRNAQRSLILRGKLLFHWQN